MFLTIVDILTILRIPSVLASVMCARGRLFHYKYRVVTFALFVIVWVASFASLCVKSIDDSGKTAPAVIIGIGGGMLLTLDY